MKTLGYCSPLVPPEWIAAHGFKPRWLPWGKAAAKGAARAPRGLCPFAGSVADAVRAGVDVDAIVLTTTCDQMRRVAEVVESEAAAPVILANIPATWETEASRVYYMEELQRLGRWLTALGGTAPTGASLAAICTRYEQARETLWTLRDRLSARRFSEAILALRSGELAAPDIAPTPPGDGGVPLAILGGPLLQEDFDLFDLVEAAGGRIALDATDAGPRTLPAAMDVNGLDKGPLSALAEAYFLAIPDVFRRPNDALYRWLAREIAARGVRGILFRRYVWCDLWHAELFRLKQWSPVPVLDIDVVGAEGSALGRTSGRLEAFLEMLR